MWRNHAFKQRIKTTERAAGLELGGNKKEGKGMDKIWKRVVGNIGGFS